ncbi:MAG: hypothetical protein MUF54_08245 [Polyangiaceae bacterium]|nr:hypothetical protein [Polyangiaceae bacterium]
MTDDNDARWTAHKINYGLLPQGVHEGLMEVAPHLADADRLAQCRMLRVRGTRTWIIFEGPNFETSVEGAKDPHVMAYIVTQKLVPAFVTHEGPGYIGMACHKVDEVHALKLR